MKIDALIAVDAGLGDDDLTFLDDFVPARLAALLRELTGGEVHFALPAGYGGRLTKEPTAVARGDRDDAVFWRSLFEKTGAEHIVKVAADAAFMDPDCIREMIDLQRRYFAEFTYSENLPPGFTCDVVGRALVDSIPDTGQKTLALGDVVRANINQFDVELYYREPDIRDKRIGFRTGNPRDRRIMENLCRANGRIPAYDDVRDLIDRDPGVLYVGPSYVELEITGRCPIDCIFCYRKSLPAERGDMDPELVRKALGDMRGFGLPYAICFGGSGEPLMHPGFYELADAVLAEPLVSALVVETNGVLAGANLAQYVAAKCDPRLKVIVNVNGLDSETYRALHGADEFARVSNAIAALKNAGADKPSLGEYLHLQVMKINETEPFLDRYYDFWEKTGIPIILQKQNTFLGLIPDRRYSDLSPLERTPCWHLQRDLFILPDGTVTFCRQDVAGTCARGSIAASTIAELWEAGRSAFLDDYAKRYPLRPDCRSCDEWYTFNL